MKLSIQHQALLRWVLLIVFVLALTMGPRTPTFQWTLGILSAILVLSAFVWPRCPHCGARVVQFNKREWVPGETCWRCHQPYDETKTPIYLLELDRAVDDAQRLRKRDPLTAERLFLAAEERFEKAYAAEKATLRERARHDPVAARTLRSRIETELKGLLKARKALEEAVKKDPSAHANLENIETLTQAAQQELAEIETVLPRTGRQ